MKKVILYSLIWLFLCAPASAADLTVGWDIPTDLYSITKWTLKIGASSGGPYTVATIDILKASATIGENDIRYTITDFSTTYPEDRYYIVLTSWINSEESDNSNEIHYINDTLRKDSYLTTAGSSTTNLFSVSGRTAFSFNWTAASSYTLTEVMIDMAKIESPTQTIIASIYADSGGSPTGTPLGTSTNTILASNFTSTASRSVAWQFNNISITSGTTYHLVLSVDVAYTDRYLVMTINTQGSGGTYNVKYFNGSSWTVQDADKQPLFATYGVLPFSAPVASTYSVVTTGGARTMTINATGDAVDHFSWSDGGDYADYVPTTGNKFELSLKGYAGTKTFSIKACDGDDNCTAATSITIKRCQCEGVKP